jgi:hypothetical protein
MDYDYWLRIDRAGGCIQHIHDVLAASRQHTATKTATARRKVYREIFHVCQKWGGRVSLNYFLGLWHHLCFESIQRRHFLCRLLRDHWQALARLHHGWHHCEPPSLPRFVWRCLAGAKRRLAHRLQRAG